METSASEHSANLAALDEFLGCRFPGRPGRTVVCQVAAADEHGTVPTSVPRCPPALEPDGVIDCGPCQLWILYYSSLGTSELQ